MTITTSQKIIKIGTSKGSTFPAKELKALGVDVGDEVEITIRKKTGNAHNDEVLQTAKSILERYKSDFTNLSKR